MVDLAVAVMTVGRERTLARFRLELTQGRNQVTRFADHAGGEASRYATGICIELDFIQL